MCKKLLIGLLICCLLVGCVGGETAVSDPQPIEQVVEVEPTPLPTESPATPIPPTATATEVIPTGSPLPTAAPTEVVPTETITPKPTRVSIMVKTYSDIQYNATNYQKLTVFQPQIEGSQLPLPTLFMMANGLADNVNPDYMSESAEYFARQGYAVVVKQSSLGSYPRFEQDALCALAWVHANTDTYGFDPERIVPLSFFGGLAAFLGTVDDPEIYLEDCPHPLPEGDLISGVITIDGVFDYSIWIPEAQEGGIICKYFGFPNEHIENMQAASPITWVDGSEPPFLLIHAKENALADPAQSEMFAVLLAEAGVTVELVRPDVMIDDNCNSDTIHAAMTSMKVRTPIKNFLAELFSE